MDCSIFQRFPTWGLVGKIVNPLSIIDQASAMFMPKTLMYSRLLSAPTKGSFFMAPRWKRFDCPVHRVRHPVGQILVSWPHFSPKSRKEKSSPFIKFDPVTDNLFKDSKRPDLLGPPSFSRHHQNFQSAKKSNGSNERINGDQIVKRLSLAPDLASSVATPQTCQTLSFE